VERRRSGAAASGQGEGRGDAIFFFPRTQRGLDRTEEDLGNEG
jgi:hypothetical protein